MLRFRIVYAVKLWHTPIREKLFVALYMGSLSPRGSVFTHCLRCGSCTLFSFQSTGKDILTQKETR